MTTEDYARMLEQHDWWYEMSDDPKAYRNGLAKEQELRSLAYDNPVLLKMYEQKRKEVRGA